MVQAKTQRTGDESSARHAGSAAEGPVSPESKTSVRLMSIDALRGFDMFWIIGATGVLRAILKETEHPGLIALRDQFTHVEWEGFAFYDLIFPLFLFLIGASLPFSFAKRLARGESRLALYRQIVSRALILTLLGMTVNGNLLTYDPAKFQITYSVLQVLALGYLVASVIYLNFGPRWRIVITVGMLLGYWLLQAFVPVPGHQVGVFQPQANLGDHLNDWILGDWQGRWRNGWILATLGYGSTAMLGVFAGTLLRSERSEKFKVLALLGLGVACLLLGLLWSGWPAAWYPHITLFGQNWTDWPIWFPIIKVRWTSSYVLFAGGYSYLLLGLFYLVIDVWRIRRWAYFFVVIGANSIFAYLCWQLGRKAFLQISEVLLGGLKIHLSPEIYEPLYLAGGTATLWILLWYLYRNRTFIKV